MRIQPVDASAFRELAAKATAGELPFGRVFTPHMVVVRYTSDHGWHDGKVVERAPFQIDPAAMCLHYGQTAFEGLKAHRQDSGEVMLFRLRAHAERMQRTADRLCMPRVPIDVFEDAVQALVTTDYAWVPSREGTSMYVRPAIIATEPALGVRPAQEYLFFVIATAAGPYFQGGLKGIRVAVERSMSRAAAGGLGSAKVGANYVASLLAAERAKAQKCSQVLWLDSSEHRWIEETGASNVFWVEGGTIFTPPTGDTVLRGITRDSILSLAPELGMPVEEKRITIDDLLGGIRSSTITEMFGSGTAAVVTPIAELLVGEEIVSVGHGVAGSVSHKLHEAITSLHRGHAKDSFGWLTPVPRPEWA